MKQTHTHSQTHHTLNSITKHLVEISNQNAATCLPENPWYEQREMTI